MKIFVILLMTSLSIPAWARDRDDISAENRELKRASEVEDADGRIWIPSELPVANAAHAERGYEVTAHFYIDANSGNKALSPEIGYRYKGLFIREDFMRETRYRLDVLYNGGLGGNIAAGWSAELGQNSDFITCHEGTHCIGAGVNVDIDGGIYTTEQKPAYARASSITLQGETAYIYTRNNQTFVLKLLGGGDVGFNVPFTQIRGGPNVGAKAELLLGNKLSILASVLHHFSIAATHHEVTEGRLGLRVRLYHSPEQRHKSGVKSVSLQFEVKAFQVDPAAYARTSTEYSQGPLRTVVTRSGLLIDY